MAIGDHAIWLDLGADSVEADDGARLDHAVEVTLAEGAGAVHWPVDDPTAEVDRLADRAGLSHRRDLFQLRRDLPLDVAQRRVGNVAIRPFRPGPGDEAAWLAVNNAAFAAHPDQGRQTPQTLHAQMAEPWFDPAGFLVIDATPPSTGLAGFCWTKVHPAQGADPALGEIYVIGVSPDAHGQGLGRILVEAGLDHLSGRDITVAMLYVDADNEAALRLYDRLGFTRHHTRRVYSTRAR